MPPPQHCKGDFCPGFTIVELLVVIVILGVVLGLALPSYREVIERRRLTQGTEQVFAFLNSAPGRRRQPVLRTGTRLAGRP